MTVEAAAAKAGPYTGNDVTSAFAFAFKVFADTDIRVIETVIATEAESDLVLNTNYTVTRNNDQDNDPGGEITYKVGGVTTALPSTKKLTIVGNFTYSQPTDIPNGGSFFAQIVENSLDRMSLQIKQIAEIVDRAVVVDVSSDDDPATLIDDLLAASDAAVASAAAAATSETNAATSETNAAASAAAAATSETNAAASASAAATSATNAATSATTATTQATNAAASAAAASTSATNAATSETNAASSATTASTQATNAATSATNAATSETNAATSASNAATSESNAAASASAAQTAVDSVMWRDVVFKVFADSPIAITDADAGKLFAIDTSGGNVVVNLPSIAGLTLANPWSVGFKKSTNDANTVTINANGTDTVDGSASIEISSVQGRVLIPDTDPAPDTWTSMQFGADALADGAVTTAKLAAGVADGLTAVTAVSTDYVVIADTSDSGNVKKALVSDIGGGGSGQFKNKIIGGDFTTNPWQRGTTFTALAGGSYGPDRFRTAGYVTSAVVDWKRTADAPTVSEAGVFSQHCLHLDVTTADASVAATDLYEFIHAIEGYNIAPFGFGQTGTRYVTLSFWVKSTKTGTFCVSFSNNAGDRYYVSEYTVSVTNTWEKKTVTIPVDTTGTWLYDNSGGLIIKWVMLAGANFNAATADTWSASTQRATSNQVNALDNSANDFKLALVQLESGQSATTFETRAYQQELDLCQRYYYRVFPNVNAAQLVPSAYMFSTTVAHGTVVFPTTMRTAPSALEQSGTAADYRVLHGATTTDCSAVPSFNQANVYMAKTNFTVAAGLTVGQAGNIIAAAASSAGYLGWSAEL